MIQPHRRGDAGSLFDIANDARPCACRGQHNRLQSPVFETAVVGMTIQNNAETSGAKSDSLASVAESFRQDKAIINQFVQVVERRAEAKMLKTGKLEGAHYAAMKELQKTINEETKTQ